LLDPDDGKYLGITVGKSWTIDSNEEPAIVPEIAQNTTGEVKQ